MRGIFGSRSGATTTSESYRSGLHHPLWWLSLLVLVVNDHLLKGAGILAASLTGKLSDFAGLIVATVLSCALFRARSPRGRALAFGLVVLPFVAIKTSALAAEWLVVLVAQVGIHWRIWSDPTDLVGLAVVPVAWRVSRVVRSSRPTLLHHVAVLLGGLGCVATSSAFEQIETAAYLVNTSHDTLEVRVYRLTSPLDCDAAAADPEGTLTPDRFELAACKRAAPFVIVPLDTDWRATADDTKQNPNADAAHLICDAVIVRIPGADDTVVFWNGLAHVQVDLHGDHTVSLVNGNEDPHAIYIEAFGTRRVIGASELFRTWTIDVNLPSPAVSCEDAP